MAKVECPWLSSCDVQNDNEIKNFGTYILNSKTTGAWETSEDKAVITTVRYFVRLLLMGAKA
jgi:hypothetical protein